eukprot:CAMPEP_0198254538 /NCGR_PEP_ID=MMETSP1447-20131203/4823_1 /TAXON_ID=420782 /ORGANISM="Chaetoceros dichaeta, Strain CCMP1751" /LENGTH=171 /DNA_ID=CAMNT_0043940625 /DNA_START=41 /DNA_END=553 /DNA_ORIENTATION=+
MSTLQPNLSNAASTSTATSNKPNYRRRPKPSSLPTTLQCTIKSPASKCPQSSSTSSSTTSNSPSSSSPKTIQTDILLQLFQDEIFIVLSQREGKLGSLLRCTVEHSVIDNSNTYEVTPLLGGSGRTNNDSPLAGIAQVYARQLHQRIVALDGDTSSGVIEFPPLLLGIALV